MEERSTDDFRSKVAAVNIGYVARSMTYPLWRPYPLSPLRTKQEFAAHYDEFFDKELTEKIFSGKWEKMGSRGIMCDDGVLWGDLDSDGKFIVTAINHTTEKMNTRLEQALRGIRQASPASLRDFEEIMLIFATPSCFVRIDAMAGESIRCAYWQAGSDLASKADNVICGGKYWSEGTLNYRCLEFRQESCTYLISEQDDGKWRFEITDPGGSQIFCESGSTVFYDLEHSPKWVSADGTAVLPAD